MVAVYVYENVSGFISSDGVGFETTITLPAHIYQFYFDKPTTPGNTTFCYAPGDVVWDGSQITNVPTVEVQDTGGTWRRLGSFGIFQDVPPGGKQVSGGDLGTFAQTLSFRIKGGGLSFSVPPFAGRNFTITMGFADTCNLHPYNPPPVDGEGYAESSLLLLGLAGATATGLRGRTSAQVIG